MSTTIPRQSKSVRKALRKLKVGKLDPSGEPPAIIFRDGIRSIGVDAVNAIAEAAYSDGYHHGCLFEEQIAEDRARMGREDPDAPGVWLKPVMLRVRRHHDATDNRPLPTTEQMVRALRRVHELELLLGRVDALITDPVDDIEGIGWAWGDAFSVDTFIASLRHTRTELEDVVTTVRCAVAWQMNAEAIRSSE